MNSIIFTVKYSPYHPMEITGTDFYVLSNILNQVDYDNIMRRIGVLQPKQLSAKTLTWMYIIGIVTLLATPFIYFLKIGNLSWLAYLIYIKISLTLLLTPIYLCRQYAVILKGELKEYHKALIGSFNPQWMTFELVTPKGFVFLPNQSPLIYQLIINRNALGVEARNIKDDDLDKYAAELILKQSNKIKNRFEIAEEPSKIPNTNKRFLANTIRSTEHYNEALKNGIVQVQSNEVQIQEPKKKKKKVKRETVRESEYNSDQDKDTEKKHLNALVKHSKLKVKKTKKVYTGKKGLVEALLGKVDQGVYGPIAGVTPVAATKDNKINPSLPESCPW
ncbi:hypothetical protein HDV06_002139 [Boothiomyces sp. JEL0866]|nr:hypothetical protein HDV06_002139 [Boothiomyces sp. JEL0866]